MPERDTQSGLQPPNDEWEANLHPNYMAGQNYGVRTEPALLTADEIKELHWRLREFSDDELKRIFIVREGERLEQGATYLDLEAPTPTPFRAMGSMTASPSHLYVSKANTDYRLWDILVGHDDPERTGEVSPR